MRVTGSKLDLAMECLHWTTLDLPDDPPGPAAILGTAFHDLAATGETDLEKLTLEQQLELSNLYEQWKKTGRAKLPANPQYEQAYSFGETVRHLGEFLGRDYPQTEPHAINLTIDVVGDGTVVDWKTGKKRRDAYEAWQLRAAAVVTGSNRVEFHYVRTGGTVVEGADFTDHELKRFAARLHQLRADLKTGNTKPLPGPHCHELYCPARHVCAGLGKTQQKEIPMGKMTLANVTTGRQQTPYYIVLYGPEGIGKSSFAAGAPSPIFLGEPGGTDHLEVARFPAPDSLDDIWEALDSLEKESHTYKSVVLDTADYIEPLIWDHVCRVAKKTSIEDLGYGKGYTKALDEWRKLTQRLDAIVARGMHVVVLAHSHLKNVRNPMGDDYEHYELKLHGKAAALLKEWPKAVLFTNYVTYVEEDEKKRVRAFGDGSRVIHTEHRPAFDAKNRYGLPLEIPLDWDEFDRAARLGEPAEVAKLQEQVAQLIAETSGDLKGRAKDLQAKAGNDAVKLSKLVDWLRAKIREEEKAA